MINIDLKKEKETFILIQDPVSMHYTIYMERHYKSTVSHVLQIGQSS